MAIFGVLRDPEVRVIWLADWISDVGNFVTFIALAVYVNNLTGSATEGDVQRTIGNGNAVVDGRAGELGLLAVLKSQIVQHCRFRERAFGNGIGVMNSAASCGRKKRWI